MQPTIDIGLSGVIDSAIDKKATDILLTCDMAPIFRIDGRMGPLAEHAPITTEITTEWIKSTMSPGQFQAFSTQKEMDYSFSHADNRIRANAFFQKGLPGLSMRVLPSVIKNYQELGLPPILSSFTNQRKGFVIICGPTGHGKSTTLASMVEEINQTKQAHIVTIEDPVEYVFKHKKSVISQREVGVDTHSFSRALRSSLREDPDVILVGEMRDFETVDAALSLAETGHLVLSTLHTNSAAQTADRMVDMFPPYLQEPARKQLANVLLGVVSQRLVPKIGGGRIIAAEILVSTPAVRTMIREGKSHQLDNIISTSASDGMISLDKVIAELISRGEISLDDGLMWSNDPKAVKTMLY